MPFVTPGIRIKEFDFSDYAPALGLTILAVIGAASKGPMNTPTLIADEATLVSTYGPPLLTDYAILSAIQYLKQGSQLLFVRIASSSDPPLAATVPLSGTTGGSPATAGTGSIQFNASGNPVASLQNDNLGVAGNVAVTKVGANITVTGMAGGSSTTKASGSVVLTGQPADGNTIVISDGVNSVTFEFDSNSSITGGNTAVTIAGSASLTLDNLITAINTSILNITAAQAITPANPADGDTITVKSSAIPSARVTNTNLGSGGNRTTTKVGANIAVTGLIGGGTSTQASGTIAFTGAVQPADGDTITLNDGAVSKTFEFDSNSSVSPGNIAVTIGGDAYATMVALITAINTQVGFNIIATNTGVVVIFEFDDNGTYTPGHTPVLIGATSAQTMANLIVAINALISTLGVGAVPGTVTVPRTNLTNTLLGTVGNATIATSAAYIGVAGLTGGVDAVAGSIQNVATIEAATPGSWGNAIQVQVAPTTVIGAPSGNFDLFVLYPPDANSTPSVVERFNNLSLDSASARFADQALLKGIRGEFGPSAYVNSETLVNAAVPSAQTVTLGTGSGVVGDNGGTPSVTDYIGTVSGQRSTGLQTLANAETTEFNVLIIPGVSDIQVINAAFSLAQTRGDFLYIVDPPFGLSVQQVVDWHNGVSLIVPNAPTQPLDTSYAALYWSWEQVFDAYNQVEVWSPPSGFMAAVFAYTDNNGGPWRVPAGFVRGKIAADAIEYSPSLAEREILEGGSNHVNAIIKTGSDGIIAFGNRTLQRRPTALDSVHTRRMLIYAEKLCATAVKFLVFDPNDPITWARFVGLVNPVLASIKANRGLADFRVICNASTNPPSQIAQHTMKAKLLIQALDAAEIIELDFTLLKNGASFTTPA